MKICSLFTLLIITLLALTQSLPTTFDLRVQPSIIKYANYALSQ